MIGEHDINTIDDPIVRQMIVALIVKSEGWIAKWQGLGQTYRNTAFTLYQNYHAIKTMHALLEAKDVSLAVRERAFAEMYIDLLLVSPGAPASVLEIPCMVFGIGLSAEVVPLDGDRDIPKRDIRNGVFRLKLGSLGEWTQPFTLSSVSDLRSYMARDWGNNGPACAFLRDARDLLRGGVSQDHPSTENED